MNRGYIVSNRIKFTITVIVVTFVFMFLDFYVLGNIEILIGDSIGERAFTWFWYLFVSSIISYLIVFKAKNKLDKD